MRANKTVLALSFSLLASIGSAATSYDFSGIVTLASLPGWNLGDTITGSLVVNSVGAATNVTATSADYSFGGSISVVHASVTTTVAFNQVAHVDRSSSATVFWRADSAVSGGQFTELLRLNGPITALSDTSYPDPLDPTPFLLKTVELDNNTSGAFAQASITSFAPVPEPATLAGLGIGMIALIRRRRNRR